MSSNPVPSSSSSDLPSVPSASKAVMHKPLVIDEVVSVKRQKLPAGHAIPDSLDVVQVQLKGLITGKESWRHWRASVVGYALDTILSSH